MTTKDTNEDNIDRYKSLDQQLKKLCKNSVYSGVGDNSITVNVELLPTLSPGFNKAFGGIALGRIYELYGPEGSSKSTLALFLVASMQALGKTCVWLDLEGTFTKEYAELCGVDVSALIYTSPDTMNEAMEVVRAVTGNNLIDFVVVDSVAAMSPEEDFDRDIGSGVIASKARIMSQSLPQIVSLCKKSNCSLLFINQERVANIGGYGPSTGTTGGKALPYACSVRIKMARTGKIEAKGEVVGLKIRADAVKNKVWYPFGSYEFQIRLMSEDSDSCGVDVVYDTYTDGMELGVLRRAGAWYYFGEEKEQGEEAFIARMRNDDEFRTAIETEILYIRNKKNSEKEEPS